MELTQPTLETLSYVMRNMREWDRREIFATQWSDDPDNLAARLIGLCEFSWIAGRDGVPIAALGAYPVWPGCWSVWMMATDEIGKIGLSLTKHVRQRMMPSLLAGNFRRAQCHSMAGHEDAQNWLRALGAKEEGRCFGYGKGGEDFLVFTWDRDAVERHTWKGPL